MRIQATAPDGAVTEYESIQAAGRAGFSVQRVHACIQGKARSHKGLTWRRVDRLHSVPLFVAARVVWQRGQVTKTSLPAESMVNAFLAWLPEDERGIDRAAALRALVERVESYSPASRTFWGVELRA